MNLEETKEIFDYIEKEFYEKQMEFLGENTEFSLSFQFDTIHNIKIYDFFPDYHGIMNKNLLFVIDLKTYLENKDSILDYLFNNLKKESIKIYNDEIEYLYNEYINGKKGNFKLHISWDIFRIEKELITEEWDENNFLIFQSPSYYIMWYSEILTSIYNNNFERTEVFTYWNIEI